MNFATSLSALRASQFAINIASQNLANASTPGYHRQRVDFVTRPPSWIQGQHIGNGVEIGRITRIRSQVLETSYTNSLSDLRNVGQSLGILQQIETEFLTGDGSIHQSLTGFFSELSRLSTNPSETASRNSAIQIASQLANRANETSQRLDELKGNVNSQIKSEVAIINRQFTELADLEQRIRSASSTGVVPIDLQDQRDQLINQIAEKIDVTRVEHAQDGFGLTIGGNSISIGSVPVEFKTYDNADGTISIRLGADGRDLKFGSGSISALVEAHNVTIDSYQGKINQFAADFMRVVDQAHAKGVGLDGPFRVLRSARNVTSTSVAINNAGLPFPVSKGKLYISVTDPAGEKRTSSIDFDPAVDSIQDLATRISSLDNLQSSVDSQNGQLSIFAKPGYRFDFTGNTETIPGLAQFTGTAVPRFSGNFEGNVNRNIAVKIVGSGTIGLTPGLTAQVTDVDSGAVIAELDIGEGYEGGTSLAVTEGVSLTFSNGTVNNDDQFATSLVADSDSTGILAALGLNSFFTGRDARDMQVSSRIMENPRDLASSRSGDLADTSNLAKLLDIREQPSIGNPGMTFQDFLGDVSSEIGFQVHSQQQLENNIAMVHAQVEAEIASVSGVDLNEEMLGIAQFQKQYEAAVQVMRTMDAMLTELMSLVR
jgi:flagellar hook-associated protein 1